MSEPDTDRFARERQRSVSATRCQFEQDRRQPVRRRESRKTSMDPAVYARQRRRRPIDFARQICLTLASKPLKCVDLGCQSGLRAESHGRNDVGCDSLDQHNRLITQRWRQNCRSAMQFPTAQPDPAASLATGRTPDYDPALAADRAPDPLPTGDNASRPTARQEGYPL